MITTVAKLTALCMVLMDVSGSVDRSSFEKWPEAARDFAAAECQCGDVRVLEVGSDRSVQDICHVELPCKKRGPLDKLAAKDRAKIVDTETSKLEQCMDTITKGDATTETPLGQTIRVAQTDLSNSKHPSKKLLILSDFEARVDGLSDLNLEQVDVYLVFGDVSTDFLDARSKHDIYLANFGYWCELLQARGADSVTVFRSSSINGAGISCPDLDTATVSNP